MKRTTLGTLPDATVVLSLLDVALSYAHPMHLFKRGIVNTRLFLSHAGYHFVRMVPHIQKHDGILGAFFLPKCATRRINSTHGRTSDTAASSGR
ncbi:hypothetical protein PsorP6_008668 [Peronosclerospora sorghi]|uniref:Uncharacterized protein n=1 Tax=Peronosclerospora sorghi TaxID=230839 RepID=A0ACC0VYH7_9STRA|nr:hypothetical protein PsorP6_008668 [Peronosclerospora sorghi]